MRGQCGFTAVTPESLNRLPQRFVYANAGNARLRRIVVEKARMPPETHHCTIFA